MKRLNSRSILCVPLRNVVLIYDATHSTTHAFTVVLLVAMLCKILFFKLYYLTSYLMDQIMMQLNIIIILTWKVLVTPNGSQYRTHTIYRSLDRLYLLHTRSDQVKNDNITNWSVLGIKPGIFHSDPYQLSTLFSSKV